MRNGTRALSPWVVGLLVVCCAAARAPALAQTVNADATSHPTLNAHADFVRSAFSGEAARDVVAYVEQFFRLPGNRGFDASLARVVERLEAAGYRAEEEAPGAALTWRMEHRPLSGPAWDPVSGSLTLVGSPTPLLDFAANRNLIAIGSYSTPAEGVEAEVVDVGRGRPEDFEGVDVEGRIVMGDASVRQLFQRAVQERGALGVLAYRIPDYNRPEQHPTSITFSSIPNDPERRSWGLLLSYGARQALREALAAGPARARVRVETEIYPSEELTLVADIRGRTHPDERLVFSAHVQEPGANDNASGVAAQSEIAAVLAEAIRSGAFTPDRTVTLLWGDEISSTRRYLEEDAERAAGVRWGLSLDMVGEDTDKTGGTFLIEKMPDPSSVWTRGEDRHTEWGGRPLSVDDLTPHYLNDLVLSRCLDQARETGWVVRTNPYEGGSDHVPFLRAGVAGLLLWHFTDVFYHTDNDRLEMVSVETLKNVGVCATTAAMALTAADGDLARHLVGEVERAALERIETERALSADALAAGGDPDEERLILETWTSWYVDALAAMWDIEVGGSSRQTEARIEAAKEAVAAAGDGAIQSLRR